MNVHDYLVGHGGFDWPTLLADWTWLLPREFTVWLMNRFGDLFLVPADGTVWMLDVGCGTLEKIADSRDDFRNRIDRDDNANQWLMIPLVDRCVAAGIVLEVGRCYSLTIPPVLGGDYTVENVATVPVAELYRMYSSIHRQIKDLPDGTPVVLDVSKGTHPDSLRA